MYIHPSKFDAMHSTFLSITLFLSTTLSTIFYAFTILNIIVFLARRGKFILRYHTNCFDNFQTKRKNERKGKREKNSGGEIINIHT